jgi:HD superfamily phosphohydrolase
MVYPGYDAIHGDIKFTGALLDVAMTRTHQDMQYRKQLGMAQLIYSGAEHTRLPHSNGAPHILRTVARRLPMSEDEIVIPEFGALGHDWGQGDLSHSLECFIPGGHEAQGVRIVLGQQELPGLPRDEIPRTLQKNSIKPEALAAYYERTDGRPNFHYDLLSNSIIDVDRMDYLLRDSRATGVTQGIYELNRLVENFVVDEHGNLGMHDKGLGALSQFITARWNMFRSVYFHRQVAAAETMLRKAVGDSLPIAMPLRFGDAVLFQRLRESGSPMTRKLIDHLDHGEQAIYSRAYVDDETITRTQIANIRKLRNRKNGASKIEYRLCSETGLERGDIIVEFLKVKDRKMPKFPIKIESGRWYDISETDIASIVQAVFMKQKTKRRLVVYTAKENVTAVANATHELLDGNL